MICICLISALMCKFLDGLHFVLLTDRLSVSKRMSGFVMPPQETCEHVIEVKTEAKGAELMSQQLRELAVLSEDQGSIPDTHMVAHTLQLQFLGIPTLLPASGSTRHASGTRTRRVNTHTHF